MENQYKTEGTLYMIANLLKRNGNYSKGSTFFDLLPINWDNKEVIYELLILSKEYGLRFKNFYFDKSFFGLAFQKADERIRKLVHDKPQTEYSKLQRRILENKFSLADVEKEYWESTDPLFGHSVSPDSLLEAVVFDIEFPGNSRNKLKNHLKNYIQHFIDGGLISSRKNVYTPQRHREIFLSTLKSLHSDHGNRFTIKESEFDSKKFLFIHCLLAFEQLGYLRVDSIQINPEYWEGNKNGYYTAHINLQPSFLKEKEVKQKSNTIDKITIVKAKSGNRFKIIINDDYHQRPLDGDMAKPSWNLLFKVADGDLIEEQEYKSSFDFFNSNEKCRLYTQTGYPKTKILKRESGYIRPVIEMEIITEKAYKQRCKKS